jgi:hypothetical protein
MRNVSAAGRRTLLDDLDLAPWLQPALRGLAGDPVGQ